MRRFYKSVDLRSRGEMTSFLMSHFRYPTMNSWNRSTSYACNLKVTNLGLEHDIVMKLLDMIQLPEFFKPINGLIYDFGEDHNFNWQTGFNGRSGGYLVLYQGEKKPSGYKSFCTACGQQNYKSTAESGNICGRCGKPARIDYPKTHRQIVTFPSRGTDDDEDFANWEMYQLKERVQLVQEFDKLADKIVQETLYTAKNYILEDETYIVQKTRQVLLPIT